MNDRQPPERGTVHRFAGWELHTDEHLLLVRGNPVRLGGPAYKLLLALIRAEGRVVSKEQLMKEAWGDRVVEDNNLTVQIRGLREKLGGDVIVNVPGFGYRLAAARVVPAHAVSEPPPPQPVERAPAARLYGRSADLQAVASRLHDATLVSIVGTGGVGKTALARAVVDSTRADWPDGTHWLDLAPLRSGAPLPQVLAQALRVVSEADGRYSEDTIQALSQLRALVVLDNCEHLLPDLAAFAPLFERSAGLRFLATSQESLGLAGEAVYHLAPLETPAPDAEPEQMLDSSALSLFLARVRAADPNARFEAEALREAATVCRQLDGLPLALEMAAARVAALGLELVRAQIGERLRLRNSARGAPQRQSTLLETFNWSYGLLSSQEQRVFRRLEPFVGGFSAQMAQKLCCSAEEGDGPALSSWEMLDALGALVQKSLVQRAPAASTVAPNRFHLLESARDFARLQLEAAGELQRVRMRHAQVVADGFELSHYELERWSDANWAAKYAPERRNLGVALAWACEARDPALLARLLAALAQLDAATLSDAEVLRHPVPVELLHEAPQPLRARAYMEYGWSHYLDGNRETGTELLQLALADFEALGDVAGVFAALVRLVRMIRGRPGMQSHAAALWARLKAIDEAEVPLRSRLGCSIGVATHFEGRENIERLWRLQRIAHSSGFDGHAASCQLHITDELLSTGRYEEAAAVARGVLRDSAAAGLGLRTVICQNLALALVRLGRFDEARQPARQLLRAMPNAAHLIMDLFAWVALATGRTEHAALMAGRSAQVKRERDWFSEPAEAALIEETLARLREAVGEKQLAELMRIGAAMTTPDVMALVWAPGASAAA